MRGAARRLARTRIDAGPRADCRGWRRLLLRVVTGHVPSERLASVKESLERDYVPVARRADGLDRYLVGTRPADTPDHLGVAFMTLWRDLDSATVPLDGQLTALRLLSGHDHGVALDRVDYYEVDIVEARRNPGTPRYLRLTAGTVRRGLDADIQRDLRGRLGELHPEIVDAYVGRRVIGDSVEIAFVSTWTDAADHGQLLEPVWPDISSQYDVFWIEVFDVLLEGSPGR